MQQDVDEWVKKYNEHRPHSGKYCYGKTPMQTFLDSKHLAQEKQLDQLSQKIDNDHNKKCIAPSGELIKSEIYHGAKCGEISEKSLDLCDRQSV